MKSSKLWWIGSLILIFLSCSKEKDESESTTPSADVLISVTHNVDQTSLVFNDLLYANKAGNPYEVSRLEYYLSDFSFENNDGSWYKPSFEPVLINAKLGAVSFTIKGIKPGNYKGISFMVGLPENWNVSGMLENNLANANMFWPEPLGGGYHFMKFEGNYIDSAQEIRGFTVHLGNNGMQSVNEFLNISYSVVAGPDNLLALEMNLNEWFENPHLFDFNKDGNYTMAVDSLMKKVSENGQHCFKIHIAVP